MKLLRWLSRRWPWNMLYDLGYGQGFQIGYGEGHEDGYEEGTAAVFGEPQRYFVG